MEGRHAQSMEAAEEKFRKAFDRVKRAAIEAPRTQGERQYAKASKHSKPKSKGKISKQELKQMQM